METIRVDPAGQQILFETIIQIIHKLNFSRCKFKILPQYNRK